MFSTGKRQRFHIHSDTNEVQVGKRKTKLTPKEMGVLELLNERKGSTVSRTEILEKVWGHDFANDQGLTQAVSRLREILSKSPDVIIRTVPKKGYLLEKRDAKPRITGFKPIRINTNFLIIMILLFSIVVLVFIKRIEIRVDKFQPEAEETVLSESK